MRLDACALNYYSYRIAVNFFPVCLCGQSIEDISHFFPHCAINSALRTNLLASAARIVPAKWDRLSEKEKVGLLLFGYISLITTTTAVF